jgi:2-polyprenyl-3-methyl-5-hydroxy-6-metoxy-1,4-benzoquinol methylase
MKIKKYVFEAYSRAIQVGINPVLKIEKDRLRPQLNERATEFAYVFTEIVKYNPQKLLDVGSGKSAFPYMTYNCGIETTALDKYKGYWDMMSNRHYHVEKGDICNYEKEEKYDMVTCIGVLEHISDYKLAVKNMAKALVKDGHLVMTFPYHEKEYIPDIYKGEKNYICQVFNWKKVVEMCNEADLDILVKDYKKLNHLKTYQTKNLMCITMVKKDEEK